MTDEQIKRMAEAAGFHVAGGLIMSPYVFGHDHTKELRRFAELARQDECKRLAEACGLSADDMTQIRHTLDEGGELVYRQTLAIEGLMHELAAQLRRARGSDK
ncbi:hypothetical protein M8A51_23470 [Schlegelella sp. S2-27]|uniref:Uncharacterized protein n=1 Tax=Caldimonas mangrovi TaxID=2944811 RepID=A0ABT0YUS7_9BURK|nr:hypothetical protein [Caldimonas mangrovi]MCM5682500.1 hypothetical protein [Caldimonas mangrovi]